MQHTRWLERTFHFDYPVTHFPFFLERLRGSLPRMVEMVEGLDDATLSKKSGVAWSLKEHIGHLADLESLHEQRIDDYVHGLATLSAADMSNKKTLEAGHNDKDIDELLHDFRDVRHRFIRHLESADDELLSRSSLHPRLNMPMRLVDMVYFVAEHDDHHFVLMRKILNGG